MAYEFLSFFFFFGGSLKWILTSFFAVYLSFLAIIRNKGKVKATSLPLLGCTFSSSLSLQVVFPLFAILSKGYLVWKTEKATERHHSIQQIQGDYSTTQPIQIPAGHLLVMQTQAGSFTHLPSGSSLVFRNRSISLL